MLSESDWFESSGDWIDSERSGLGWREDIRRSLGAVIDSRRRRSAVIKTSSRRVGPCIGERPKWLAFFGAGETMAATKRARKMPRHNTTWECPWRVSSGSGYTAMLGIHVQTPHFEHAFQDSLATFSSRLSVNI